jgi:regulator of protease activity HflC (stomatin/prohibitin superfamily)
MDVFSIALAIAVLIFVIWLFNGIYIIKEWERGAVLRIGRMLPQPKGAGLQLILAPLDKLIRISLRIELSKLSRRT